MKILKKIKINGIIATTDDWGRLVFDLICKGRLLVSEKMK